MAELHVLGEIEGGTSFKGKSFFCSYEIIVGSQWMLVEGTSTGSSHVMRHAPDGIIWSFPIDCHFTFTSAQGWPRIALHVWEVDAYGRKDLAGYGVGFVPMPNGDHSPQTVVVSTWKPTYWSSWLPVRMFQQLRQNVMGGNPVLRDDSLVHSNDARYKLYTISGGDVTLKLTVVTKNAAIVGLRFK